MPTIEDLRNPELVTLVVALLGGDLTYVDHEDIAVKSDELVPGRFSWRKYAGRIDLVKISDIVQLFQYLYGLFGLKERRRDKGVPVGVNHYVTQAETFLQIIFLSENISHLLGPVVVIVAWKSKGIIPPQEAFPGLGILYNKRKSIHANMNGQSVVCLRYFTNRRHVIIPSYPRCCWVGQYCLPSDRGNGW